MKPNGHSLQQIFCRGTTVRADILSCFQFRFVHDAELNLKLHCGFLRHAERLLNDPQLNMSRGADGGSANDDSYENDANATTTTTPQTKLRVSDVAYKSFHQSVRTTSNRATVKGVVAHGMEKEQKVREDTEITSRSSSGGNGASRRSSRVSKKPIRFLEEYGRLYGWKN